MSRERAGEAASRALDRLARQGAADGEALARRSRGNALRLARGTPREASAWEEEGLAVLAVDERGAAALATDASWDAPEQVADRALALARAQHARERAVADAPPHRCRLLAPARPDGSALAAPALDDAQALAAALARVESAALAEHEAVVALDAVQARGALVDSYLATLAGGAAHQRHATSLAHASVLVRDGLRAATRAEGWGGPRLTLEEAEAFGQRAARSAVAHLMGSGAAPPHVPRLLLGPGAVAELTFSFGLALVGLVPADGPGWQGASSPHPALSLAEDALLDAGARALPLDGAGRPLRYSAIVHHGTWTRPGPGAAPWVRPGLADLPRPAWMRLSWGWDDGADEAGLMACLEKGLAVESLHATSIDVTGGRFSGLASGWWVEEGRRRHAVAGIPLSLEAGDLLGRAVAGGRQRALAHPSGVIRSIALVVVRPG